MGQGEAPHTVQCTHSAKNVGNSVPPTCPLRSEWLPFPAAWLSHWTGGAGFLPWAALLTPVQTSPGTPSSSTGAWAEPSARGRLRPPVLSKALSRDTCSEDSSGQSYFRPTVSGPPGDQPRFHTLHVLHSEPMCLPAGGAGGRCARFTCCLTALWALNELST